MQKGAKQKTPSRNGRQPGFFTRFANQTARLSGTPLAFGLAFGTIIVWGITGPLFNFSDTWQLVINTGTTIVTFLMVFLIQNTQNRDTEALHLKIDELIRATKGAKNSMINLEDMSLEELDEFKRKFAQMAQQGRLEDPGDFEELVEEAAEETREEHKHHEQTKSHASTPGRRQR